MFLELQFIELFSDQNKLSVVGIGADGWAGLNQHSVDVLTRANLIIGSQRQLAGLPKDLAGQKQLLPSPIEGLYSQLQLAIDDGKAGGICVLASGDPMLHGVGASLAARIGPQHLKVISHPSAFSLACARLGWTQHQTTLVSGVANPLQTVVQWLQPGRRLVVYVNGIDGAEKLCEVLVASGFGNSQVIALDQLGGPDERQVSALASQWPQDSQLSALHCVAIQVAACAVAEQNGRTGESTSVSTTQFLPRVPGLPDDAYETDGQITRSLIRASSLAALAPCPHSTLWDVGAGSGSIGIEWLRSEPTAVAYAIEPKTLRAQRAARNAERLGVPHLQVICGSAPHALHDLPDPDAIFIGGGITTLGLLDLCLQRLKFGGRLVANTVTLEGDQLLHQTRQRLGGSLLRISAEQAQDLGTFTGWKPERAVVQWSFVKENL